MVDVFYFRYLWKKYNYKHAYCILYKYKMDICSAYIFKHIQTKPSNLITCLCIFLNLDNNVTNCWKQATVCWRLTTSIHNSSIFLTIQHCWTQQSILKKIRQESSGILHLDTRHVCLTVPNSFCQLMASNKVTELQRIGSWPYICFYS